MFWFDFNWQIQHFLNQFWWLINFGLLAALVILGYLAAKKPIYALGLTIIFLPTYLFRSQIWFLPFTFLELCIWVTFIGWLINAIRHSKSHFVGRRISDLPAGKAGILQSLRSFRMTLKGYGTPIILILITAIISVFISPNFRSAAGLWRAYFIEPILFFLVLIKVTKTSKDKEILLWSLGISTLAISLLAIYQKFSGFGIAQPGWVAVTQRRVTASFTSPNAVGLFLGPVVAIYLGWLVSEIKNYSKTILKLVIIILALLAILFTISQGTWLGLLAAIIFLAYFACPTKPEGWSRGWNKKLTTAIVVAVVILVLIISPLRRIAWPMITFQDLASQNRLELLQISRDYLSGGVKNFIFGAGIAGFGQIQEQFRDPLKMEALIYPHNIFLNFWLEIGLLGLVAFIWLVIKFFKKGFQEYQSQKCSNAASPLAEYWLKLGIMAAMITIIIHGLVDVPYFKNDLAVLFWVIIGLII